MADSTVRKFYWGSGSPWCWRVQLVLEEKALPYESHLISFSERGHKSPEILAINPRGQVPSFQDGDIIVNESGAACQYLEFRYPDVGPKLLPDTPAERARILQLMYEVNNLGTEGGKIGRYTMTTKPEDRDPAVLAEHKAAIKKELAILEKYLEAASPGAPAFLGSTSISMADMFFFPMLAQLVRLGLDIAVASPAFAAYYEHMRNRKSVLASWPPHWKETPGQTVLSDG